MRDIIKKILLEHKEKGTVYFYDREYPGYMYVKEILPSYRMYWASYHNRFLGNMEEAELVRDNELDIYWLTSPSGEEFAYELLPHTEIYTDLDEPHWSLQPLDAKELDAYSRENKIFPTNQ